MPKVNATVKAMVKEAGLPRSGRRRKQLVAELMKTYHEDKSKNQLDLGIVKGEEVLARVRLHLKNNGPKQYSATGVRFGKRNEVPSGYAISIHTEEKDGKKIYQQIQYRICINATKLLNPKSTVKMLADGIIGVIKNTLPNAVKVKSSKTSEVMPDEKDTSKKDTSTKVKSKKAASKKAKSKK